MRYEVLVAAWDGGLPQNVVVEAPDRDTAILRAGDEIHVTWRPVCDRGAQRGGLRCRDGRRDTRMRHDEPPQNYHSLEDCLRAALGQETVRAYLEAYDAGREKEFLASLPSTGRVTITVTTDDIVRMAAERNTRHAHQSRHDPFVKREPGCQFCAAYQHPRHAHLWPCGCLINSAGAHRVGCPDYPEGVRDEHHNH